MIARFTSRYERAQSKEGFSFRFFCDLCDSFVEIPEGIGTPDAQALDEAKAQARRYFNMCHKCGKWICDSHYNEDEMQCIVCAPPESSLPRQHE